MSGGNASAATTTSASAQADACPFSGEMTDEMIDKQMKNNPDILALAEDLGGAMQGLENLQSRSQGLTGQRMRRNNANIGRARSRVRRLENQIDEQLAEVAQEYADLSAKACEQRAALAERGVNEETPGGGFSQQQISGEMTEGYNAGPGPRMVPKDTANSIGMRQYNRTVSTMNGMGAGQNYTTGWEVAEMAGAFVLEEAAWTVAGVATAGAVTAVRVTRAGIKVANAINRAGRAAQSAYNRLPSSVKTRLDAIADRYRARQRGDAPEGDNVEQTPPRSGIRCAC